MRFVFIRHGHPNYSLDNLTPTGHLQAEAASLRLLREGISAIYSSTKGRAMETAEHTAKKLGLPIIPLDFMCEIGWGSTDGTELHKNGHPWYTADNMVQNGIPLLDLDWNANEPFSHNLVTARALNVGDEFDRLLLPLGYRREGLYYRVTEENDRTYALFSHGGSSSAVLSRLLGLPFPFVCGVLSPSFTGITTLSFSTEVGALIAPKIEVMNDHAHILDIDSEQIISN